MLFGRRPIRRFMVVAAADCGEEQRVAGRHVEHPQQVRVRFSADLDEVDAEEVALQHEADEFVALGDVHRVVPADQAAVRFEVAHHRLGELRVVVADRRGRKRREGLVAAEPVQVAYQ
ncbi:hypothetical protein [Dactylosporangium sp. CA-092794]|uniref:hypothetical protein n=1 Tax=Dactylosporangium sp. CA-092794 TaxID=3239929 RepID=UPI003D8DBEAB